jgi:methane/ammonia monooxygenase subunit C
MSTLSSRDLHLNPTTDTTSRFTLSYVWFAVAMTVLTGVYVSYRVYQQMYGMSAGLDSTEPIFQDIWMRLFWIQLPVLFGIVALIQVYLFVTRDRNIDAITPEVELKRYFALTMWLVVYTFTFYWIGSFFGEGDGNWHQTVLRDTPITPSHVVLFYACIPLYLMFGIGSFVYAMTRIPAFCKGISLMHVFAVVGPFLILPNLGYNEWGHAFWLMEEYFSAPLHWGFVVLGWSVLALGGLLVQILQHLMDAIRRAEIQAEAQSLSIV